MNINEQKTALCYFLQIQDSDIFYLKIWIRDKNSLFAPLLTGQYFCCWFSPHPYFMFLLCLLPHSGSILDSQLSWESGKFQLARWIHEMVIFPEGIIHPPTWPYRFFLLNILHSETWISSVALQTQLVFLIITCRVDLFPQPANRSPRILQAL